MATEARKAQRVQSEQVGWTRVVDCLRWVYT